MVTVGAVVLLSGCSPQPVVASVSPVPALAALPTTPPATSVASPPTPTGAINVATQSSVRPPSGFSWRPVVGSPGLDTTTVDGGAVTLLWMNPRSVKFRYVPGYRWPEGGPSSRADSQPTTWITRMVASFNGGFKLSDRDGGYYYLGHMVSPLRPGLAAFVVYRDGSMRVGVWGHDLHMNSNVVVVRENLPPLVLHGSSRTRITDTRRTWGIALSNRWNVSRSALGIRPDGSLLFEFGQAVTPATMAKSLVAAGTSVAVVLDMNRTWPTGFVYTHHNGQVHGSRINSWIYHSPAIYLKRYEKDFIAVESR